MTRATFTVRHLLQLPVLREAKLLSGGRGMDNEIYYVDILEVPEFSGWVRPCEFLLTTGYSFQENPFALCNLLDEMNRLGGAAIGIKTKRFLGEIPHIAIEKSEQYGIPLIDIPPEVPYVDITHSVIEQILNHQVVLLREVQAINHQFMNLVVNRRIAELVVMIGQLLTCEVAVVNRNGEIERSTPGFRPEDVRYSRRIQVGQQLYGELVLTRAVSEEDRFARICLDQAVMVLAVEFSAKDSAARARERAREEFFIELLAGTPSFEDIAQYRAQQLGFPTGKRQYIITLQAVGGKAEAAGVAVERGRIYEMIGNELKKNGGFSANAHALVGQHVAVMCSTSQTGLLSQRTEAVEAARSLRQYLYEKYHVRFLVGIGLPREQLTELRSSYVEAKKALEYGQKVVPDEGVYHYSEMYVEDLLMGVNEHPALQALYEIYLLPVQIYDRNNGSQLFPTLDAYVRHGGNTKRVAAELFVHRNSVNYRVERIKDILQTDIDDPKVMLQLDLVLRAYKLSLVGK